MFSNLSGGRLPRSEFLNIKVGLFPPPPATAIFMHPCRTIASKKTPSVAGQRWPVPLVREGCKKTMSTTTR